MPTLDVSELNVVIAVLGGFMLLYGVISVKIKSFWYLGEACPAAARLLDATEWGSAVRDQQEAITLGLCRVAIGVQLVMAGYQLPAQYQRYHWKEMFICLIPNMTLMWLLTSGCVMASIPDMPFVSALVIGSCVTCTDPILSQAVAKGPFADKYVARELREIISSEAGINDGFGFPFLMLATYIMRHAQGEGYHGSQDSHAGHLLARAGDVGRQGGGVGEALGNWVVETWLYYVVLGALALNWDGGFLAETEARHDEVNASIDVLLNFGGFMYIGAIFPWDEFHQPDLTGITYPRLILLGVMVLLLRRIPSILLLYKLMPRVCKNWKEALFMGYFGPIGIGAVFYVEHTRHLFPKPGNGDETEAQLMRAIGPTVYWLVFFSIFVHGLSIPALNAIYTAAGVPPVVDPSGPAEIRPLSANQALPKNSYMNAKRRSIMLFNRFSRANYPGNLGWELPFVHDDRRERSTITGFDLTVLALSIVKQGEGEIPDITDTVVPKRLGFKRVIKIRSFFGLDKKDNIHYAIKRRRAEASRETANDYVKLFAGRVHKEKTKSDELRKRRSSLMRK
ncbi:hypothetical protein N8T08_004495 [Aspergillus melleus]|uniref:Uncharacterized protein n=1 Tax=Aspergillus melleus TaxID=138277 RepID=A0ACC3B3R8_9EURO|nr:hypothetical protein N8T08_004495 [Aspergillus melleus]